MGWPAAAKPGQSGLAVDEERGERGSKSSRYHYYLLELRYLRRHFPPSTFPTTVEAMPGYLNVSPTRFFIHLDEAIDDLCRRLLGRLNPGLRLERPALARPPVGRAATRYRSALADLDAGRSVAITRAGRRAQEYRRRGHYRRVAGRGLLPYLSSRPQ